MLSLAWPLLGDLYSLLTNLGSAPPPPQLIPVLGGEVCGALFGHRSYLARRPEEAVQGPDPAVRRPL